MMMLIKMMMVIIMTTFTLTFACALHEIISRLSQ